MPSLRSISVLMPILNGARYLDRVLGALAGQRVGVPWDFLAADCGSTDGTLEIFARRAASFPVPLRVHGIHREEFNHGCTRNLLAALSSGELLVYLTDDAIPMGEGWLARLAACFDDPSIAAVSCRNVTRPEADALVRTQNAKDPTYGVERRAVRLPDPATYARMSAHERRLLYNYCDSASAMRRALWERHPYPRCTFGEDVLQARALLEAGHTVLHEPDAPVEHSHDQDAAETYRRARVDGEAHAEWFDWVAVPTAKTAERLARAQLREDRRALRAEGLRRLALVAARSRARELRRAYFFGLHEGGRSRRRFPPTRLLEARGVRALVVLGSGASSRVRDLVARLGSALAAQGHALESCDEEALAARVRAGAGVDLVHVHSPGGASLAAIAAVLDAEIPLLVHFHDASEADGDAELLYACRQAPLALAATRSLRERLLARAGFDGLQLALSPDAESATERARTVDEQARELAFRYRALAAARGARAPAVVLEQRAARAERKLGDARDVGYGAVLLGPRAAAVELVLRDLPAGPVELDVSVGFTALPADVASAGRVLVDDRARCRFGPFRAVRRGESRTITVRLDDGASARALRIENATRSGGRPHFLRVERVVALRRPADPVRPSERLAALAARLSSAVDLPVKAEA